MHTKKFKFNPNLLFPKCILGNTGSVWCSMYQQINLNKARDHFRIKIILRNSVLYFAIGKAVYKCIKCSSKHCSIENYSLSFNIESSVHAYLMKELFFRVTIYTEILEIYAEISEISEISMLRYMENSAILKWDIKWKNLQVYANRALFYWLFFSYLSFSFWSFFLFHLYLHLKFQKSVSLLVEI